MAVRKTVKKAPVESVDPNAGVKVGAEPTTESTEPHDIQPVAGRRDGNGALIVN